MRVHLLARADVATHRGCEALATSANAGLVANANPAFWRFVGRKNVDGCIHRVAGAALQDACDALPTRDTPHGEGQERCGVGRAVFTPGVFGELHCGGVIHAVAPDGAYAAGLMQW